MKDKDFSKYYLSVTEQYYRVYYKPEPKKLDHKTTNYKIEKGLEISTSVSTIVVKDYYKENGKIVGLIIEYINEDYEDDTIILKIGQSKRIVLKTGEGDVYRYSVCDLKLQIYNPDEDLKQVSKIK